MRAAMQEDADELRMSLRAISENLDSLEAGGLMWHEVRPLPPLSCIAACS